MGDTGQGCPCLPFPALTQLVLDLHRQVVGVHDDPVLGGRLHRSHHCEDEEEPGVGVCLCTHPVPDPTAQGDWGCGWGGAGRG